MWWFANKGVTPNDITYIRSVVFAVVIGLWLKGLINQDIQLLIIAFLVAIPSWISDRLDGDLARVTNQMTELGKHFDPFADKLKFYFAMALFSPYISVLGVVFLTVNAILDIYSTHMRSKQTQAKSGANNFGKFKLGSQVTALGIYAIGVMFIVEQVELGAYVMYLGDLALGIAAYFAIKSTTARKANI